MAGNELRVVSTNEVAGPGEGVELPGMVSRVIPRQASNDAELVGLWLAGRPEGTKRMYRDAVGRFFAAIGGTPLQAVHIGDVQGWASMLEGEGKAPSTRARMLASVKSLFTFAHRIGYVNFDVAAAVRLPKIKDDLAARILTETQVYRMIDREPSPRNRAMLTLMYSSAARVSEISGLRWSDCTERPDLLTKGFAGQVTLFGKGGKTRAVQIATEIWAELVEFRPVDAAPTDPVFPSAGGTRKGERRQGGGPIDAAQVYRIVRDAAARADIRGKVGPHHLRHSHASHSLENGAPIALVQATLGHTNLATTGRYTHARPSDSSSRFLRRH